MESVCRNCGVEDEDDEPPRKHQRAKTVTKAVPKRKRAPVKKSAVSESSSSSSEDETDDDKSTDASSNSEGEDDEQGKGSDAESDEWDKGEDSDVQGETEEESETSEDEDDICKDCGKALEGEIWKRLPIHKKCGRMRGRLTTALEDNPQLLQVLVDARKNDPPTYRVLLKEVNIDEKGKHLSQNQKQLIAKKANELQKRQDIESKDGMYFFTEAEFIHHWKGRIGLNEKDGRKLYVKERAMP